MHPTTESRKPILPRLEKQKSTLAKKVLSIKDENTIELLLSYYQDLISTKRITKAQYNRELKAAEKSVNEGNFVTNEQVMKEMKKW
jgi:hypothetical protein